MAHNPFSAAENFSKLDSAAQRSAVQSYSWRARSTQAEGFLQPQQSGVLGQRSMSRQNLVRMTISTPQKHFTLPGDSGSVALNDKARPVSWLTAHPRNKKCASLVRAASWNLNRPQKSISIFKTIKYIALGYTNTYNLTHTHLFALKMNYRTQMQRKDAIKYYRVLHKFNFGININNCDPCVKSSPPRFCK